MTNKVTPLLFKALLQMSEAHYSKGVRGTGKITNIRWVNTGIFQKWCVQVVEVGEILRSIYIELYLAQYGSSCTLYVKMYVLHISGYVLLFWINCRLSGMSGKLACVRVKK